MKSAEEISSAGQAAAPAEESRGFVRDWVLPVVLGLVIGGGLVGGWKYGKRLFQSKAAAIVQKLKDEDADPDAIEKDLRALGASAREDVLKALVDLPADQVEEKIWVAHELAGEPWFATTSLKELIADQHSSKEDKRACAAGLIDAQSKEVDTELVLPVLVEWVGDAASPDRAPAVGRLETMWRAGMLNSKWEAAVKRSIAEMGKRGGAVKPDDADRVAEERAQALHALALALPADEEIVKLEWAAAKDETDDDRPRVGAIRALAEANVLGAETVDDWLAVSKSADGVVRQSVADNLSKTNLPVFDKVLEPLQFDANMLARSGALDTQIHRHRPTMLKRFDELTEDSYNWVRFYAMFAAGVFKHESDGLGARAGIMLRVVESSDDDVSVKGAVLGLRLLTDKVHGFQPGDIHVNTQDVDDTALKTFMADKAGRKQAADQWRADVGASAVWTDGDRKATLEKLLKHADPDNVAHAKAELEKLR